MYLNTFAPGLDPLDRTELEEFESLLASAADQGIPIPPADALWLAQHRDDLRFHLLEWGDHANSPLVLLHGGNQTAHSWDLVSLHLADRFHVVALDQRGHGDSEWPRDSQAAPPDLAADVAELIALLGLRDAAESRCAAFEPNTAH